MKFAGSSILKTDLLDKGNTFNFIVATFVIINMNEPLVPKLCLLISKKFGSDAQSRDINV